MNAPTSAQLARPMTTTGVRAYSAAATGTLFLICTMAQVIALAQAQPAVPAKQGSTFYPASLFTTARENIARHAWARAMRDRVIEGAEPWMAFSDDELWAMMFGNTITRSWMVWSNGHCPACRESVPMYNWQMDALARPWTVRCPHCSEVFPKNDFRAFYRSGLDEQGIFDPGRADRSLLFNREHPDPADPLHAFGVDDGEGYVDGDRRWRFIGAYLIYGQWKQAVLGGIRNLAAAYVVAGDQRYAHKAGVLLDRVADLYPTFDFGKQGLVYEGRGAAGYVSTWHDACEETRELALAYDQVFEGLRDDEELVRFLSRKAADFGLSNPKASFADVQRNIEDRILRDAIANSSKISSNYPRTPIALATMTATLAWPENRDAVYTMIDDMLGRATAVDGVTGEKGLAGYSSYVIQGLGQFLEQFARIEPGFLEHWAGRQPRLRQTYRFHIDTLCLGRYYPLSGDTGSFARPVGHYVGLTVTPDPGVTPSMFAFLWRLCELTGDAAYVQTLYRENGSSTDGLPHDLFATDPQAFQQGVAAVIGREGLLPRLRSVNKEQWHLAILRSGHGGNARAAWLDYDSGGGHSHADGMNLGLFAKGLDLMPDFGYPPVQFGGWGSPRARWYTMSAAHNTVVVDGENHANAAGRTTLWADGKRFHAIRASAPALIGGEQFERTVAQVDVSERDFYLVDVFRVAGGTDHAKFVHSHFGRITPHGLSLQPADDYGHGTQMRSFRHDPGPAPGWSVDWAIDDRHGLLPPGRDVHLRYTDLTEGAEASTAEGWVVAGIYDSSKELWIPRLMVRRKAETAPLRSTFVAVIEPYEGASRIASIRRLPLQGPGPSAGPDNHVAVEITLADGRRDLLVTTNAENLDPARGTTMLQPDWGLELDGDSCWVRVAADGEVQRIAACHATSVTIGGVELPLQPDTGFVEVTFEGGRAAVVSGDASAIRAEGAQKG